MRHFFWFCLLSIFAHADGDLASTSRKWYLLGNEKGSLYTSSSTNDYKISPGTDGLCLLTDSTQTAGIKWGSCSGGSGAPVDAQYWTGAANATLTQEKNLGALSTGLVINTAGVPSAYAGASCTNQFPRSLNASGAATCASVSLTADVTGTLAQGNGGTGAGGLTCSSIQRLTSNGTVYSCSDLPSTTATVDFGASPGSDTASVVVTGASWVTSTSNIVCNITMLATADRTEGMEDAVIENLNVSWHTRVAGTGFTIMAHPAIGRAVGKFLVHCQGS